MTPLSIIKLSLHPITQASYIASCKNILDERGVLVLRDFLTDDALQTIKAEGETNQHHAFYAASSHNVYLTQPDERLPADHPRNRQVISSKGCITDDRIPVHSPLRALYNAESFNAFLCGVLGEVRLYPYADRLSSINLHYASAGQELGWHFDNSSFAITLLIQKPQAGGIFEYVSHLRDADKGDLNVDGVQEVFDGQRAIEQLAIEPGDLVLFRGRNAMHRVTPTEGDVTRMLAVLAYNAQPDISLSETARMTFYGRL